AEHEIPVMEPASRPEHSHIDKDRKKNEDIPRQGNEGNLVAARHRGTRERNQPERDEIQRVGGRQSAGRQNRPYEEQSSQRDIDEVVRLHERGPREDEDLAEALRESCPEPEREDLLPGGL